MNSYERVLAALEGRQPDRVPVMLHNFLMAAEEAGFTQDEYRNDPKKIAQSHIEAVEKYGYDVKFAYHTVRLLLEIEQILVEGDLDLERNREILKSVRRGEWALRRVEEWFSSKEESLEQQYADSSLPWGPPESEIKELLLNCLEHHYGSLAQVIQMEDRYIGAINEIREIVSRI